MDEWTSEHLLSMLTVLGGSAYIPQMLARVGAHRHPGVAAVVYHPLQQWRTYSSSYQECCWQKARNYQPALGDCFDQREVLCSSRGCIQQLLNTRVSKPQLSSPTQDGSKGSSHLSSIEAASKFYLSLCSVLLPFLPFPGDSSQQYSLISHLLDNLHLRDCFPENAC